MTVFTKELRDWQEKIESFAKRQGLDFPPVVFDVVDAENMAEVASYHGFPDHFSHWKFGEAYLNMKKKFSYGLGKIYEMVINTNPAIAYLLEENKLIDQKTVIAHVYAHVDFFKNNAWFSPTDRNMLATSRAAAERIDNYRREYGEDKVDDFIVDCMKIDNLIDFRLPYIKLAQEPGEKEKDKDKPKKGEQPFSFKSNLPYLEEFINPPDWVKAQEEKAEKKEERKKKIQKGLKFPAKPVRDVLLFLLRFAPLEQWQRDILDIIRQESYYLLPQVLTKITNEGWAAYWHSKLMVEERLASRAEIVDYARHNAGTLSSPGLNPYKLGLVIYQDIEYRWDTGRHGLLWKNCRRLINRKADWDDFVVFKNIYREDPNRVGEKWAEWCFFKRACHEGLAGFPKDVYQKEKLVKWWRQYQEAGEESEPAGRNGQTKKELNWRSKLAKIRQAWQQSSDAPKQADPIPEKFFSLAAKYPGKVALGQGRKKIFEVRTRINDLSLINEFFTQALFEKIPMFSYKAGGGGVPRNHWGIDKSDFKSVKRKLLFNLFNAGEPVIEIVNAQYAWSKKKGEYRGNGLYLEHRHEGADLKQGELEDTLKALYSFWQGPVYLETIVSKQEKDWGAPLDILQQMGIHFLEEASKKKGTVRIYFTLNGEEVNQYDKQEIEYQVPY